jgi:hypothetical protein
MFRVPEKSSFNHNFEVYWPEPTSYTVTIQNLDAQLLETMSTGYQMVGHLVF